MMNPNQIQAIAAVVASIRPEWGEQGIRAALIKIENRDPFDVTIAAVKAAREQSNRTPGVIPQMGPHWVEAKPSSRSNHGERLAKAKASMAAVRACSLCDDNGYRLPKGLTLCAHIERTPRTPERAS